MRRRELWALAASVTLVGAGVILALLTRHFYWPVTLVGSGLVGAVTILAGPRRREAWRDWRPPLRAYLIPFVLCVAGLIVAFTYRSRPNVIGVGLAVSSGSVAMAMSIWFKRALNTSPHSSGGESTESQ